MLDFNRVINTLNQRGDRQFLEHTQSSPVGIYVHTNCIVIINIYANNGIQIGNEFINGVGRFFDRSQERQFFLDIAGLVHS